jgi:hypothetical protein
MESLLGDGATDEPPQPTNTIPMRSAVAVHKGNFHHFIGVSLLIRPARLSRVFVRSKLKSLMGLLGANRMS